MKKDASTSAPVTYFHNYMDALQKLIQYSYHTMPGLQEAKLPPLLSSQTPYCSTSLLLFFFLPSLLTVQLPKEAGKMWSPQEKILQAKGGLQMKTNGAV